MAGKAYIKNSSTQWKIIKKAYYKVGASWVPIQKAYVKVGNLWKKVFDSASQAPIGTLTRILYKGYAQNNGEYVGDLPSSWVKMGPDADTWGTGTTYLWGEDGTWDANGGTISFYRRGFYYNTTNDRNTYTLITGTNAEGNVDAGGGGDKLRNASGYISDYDNNYLWYVTSATNTAGVTGFSAANPTFVTRQSPIFSNNDYDNFYFDTPDAIPSGGTVKFNFYIADEWYRRINKSLSYMEFAILDNATDEFDSGTKIGSNILMSSVTTSTVNDVLYGSYNFTVPSSSTYLGKYLAARMILRNSYTEWWIYTPVESNLQVSTGRITATPVVEVAPTITKKDSNQTQGYYLTGNAGRWTPDATSVEYGWQYSTDGETGWTDVRYVTFAGGFGLVYPVFIGTDTSENGSYDYLIPSTFYTNSSGSTTPSNGKYLRFWSQGAVDGVKAVKTYTAAVGPIYKPPTNPGKPDIAYYSAGPNSGSIVAGFVWDASTSFYRYQIERKSDGTSVWGLLKDNITTNGGWFSKETAVVPLGKATYRIVAVNEDGVKAYSLETEFTASGLPSAFNINSAVKGLEYSGRYQNYRDVKTFWGASTNAERYAVRYQGTNTAPGTSGRDSTWVDLQGDFIEWAFTTDAPATDDTRANLRYLKTVSLQYAYGTYSVTVSGEHNFVQGQNVWLDFNATSSPSESGVYTVSGLFGSSGFTVLAKSYSPVVYSSTNRPEVSVGWFDQTDYPAMGGYFYGGARQVDVYSYYRVAVRAENSASDAELNPTYSNSGSENDIKWFELTGSGPQGLSISEFSKGGTFVNVTASVTSGGSSNFSKYQWSTNNSTWTDDATSPVNVTGLTKATAYTIYIRAVNTEGLFSETKTLSVTTPSGVGAFNVLSATKAKISASVLNKRRITATWENPTDGVYYELQVEGSNNAPSATTRTWTVLQSVAGSPYIDKPSTGNATGTFDADNYSYYRVSVRARDTNRDLTTASYSNGGTAEDALVYFEATGTAPNAVTMPDTATVTKNSLSIDYTLPTGANTGSAALSTTEYKNGSSGTWTATTADPLVISSLEAGTDYTIYMRTTNSDGLTSSEASKTYTTTKVPLAFTISSMTFTNGTAATIAVSKEIAVNTSNTSWTLGTDTDTAYSGADKYRTEAWSSNATTMTYPGGSSASPGYTFRGINKYDYSSYTGYGTLNVRVSGTSPVPKTKISWNASTNAKSYTFDYKIGALSTTYTSVAQTDTFYEWPWNSSILDITLVKVTAWSNNNGTGESVVGTFAAGATTTGKPTETWGTSVTKTATIAKPFVSPTASTPTPSFSRFWQTATTATRQQGLNWYWNNPTVNDDGQIFGWDWEVRATDVTNYSTEPIRWGWATWTGRTVPSGTNRGMQPYNTTKGYTAQVWSGSGSTNNNVNGTPHHNRIRSTNDLPSSNAFRYGRIRVVLKGTNNQYYPQSWSGNV
jgi:hypothetical protein